MVLSGLNEEAHIQENLGIAEEARPGALTAAELALVDQAAKKYKALMKVGCTGCGYCMPCPSNVRIPGCFEIYNNMHTFNTGEMATFQYAVLLSGDLTGRPGYASQCVECGECLEKCPQNIEIPEVLAQVAAEMETDDMADKVKMVLKPNAE